MKKRDKAVAADWARWQTKWRFKELSPQSVVSDHGFIVRSAGRYALEYLEGERLLKVPREIMAASFPDEIHISKAKHWEPPYDNEILSLDKVSEIKTRIGAALTYLHIPHEFF
jgi:hypothetical protein